jgi:hypothetical protein
MTNELSVISEHSAKVMPFCTWKVVPATAKILATKSMFAIILNP